MRRHPMQLLLLSLLGLFLMRESRLQPASIVDDTFVNWLAANAERVRPSAPLTLIEINDSSLRAGHDWPWSPLDFALFLQAARPLAPRVLGIEHVLAWEMELGATDARPQVLPQYEKILLEQILQAPKIFLGARLGFPEDPSVIPPLQEAPSLRHVYGNPSAIPEFTLIEEQPEEKFRLSAARGFTNVPDAGAVVRRVPLLFRYRGEVVPSLTLQAMMLWQGTTPDEVRIEIGSRIWLGNALTIPIDTQGALLVDFAAGYERYGYDDLLLAAQQAEAGRIPIIPVENIRDRMVLLARSDEASRTLQFPSGRRGSSGQLFAAAIATIMTEKYIHRAPWWVEAAIIALVVLLAPWCLRRRVSTLLLGLAAGFIAYLFVCLVVFGATLLWMPVLLPFGLLAMLGLLRLLTPQTA